MGFQDAFRILQQRPFSFQGRASRSEFWWITLILYLAGLVLVFGTVILSAMIGGIAYLLFVLGGGAMMLAQLAISARRLHDKGLTGWVNLLIIVPFGSFALLVLWLLPGDYGTNDYGPPVLGPRPVEDDIRYTRSNIPNVRDDD